MRFVLSKGNFDTTHESTLTMSSMNFSSAKQSVKPPQRGIFPLDHYAECKPFMEVRTYFYFCRNNVLKDTYDSSDSFFCLPSCVHFI